MKQTQLKTLLKEEPNIDNIYINNKKLLDKKIDDELISLLNYFENYYKIHPSTARKFGEIMHRLEHLKKQLSSFQPIR